MLVQLVFGRFDAGNALFESLLICGGAAMIVVRRIVVPRDPRNIAAIVLMGLLVLLFRWNPFLYVEGGQDQGVYVSMSAHFARTQGLPVKDKVREKLSAIERTEYDKLNNRYDTENFYVPGRSEGEHQPGIFIGDLSRSAYVFQFYPLHPLWMALAAKVLGAENRVYSLVGFSLLNVLMLSLLAYELSGRKRAPAFIAAGLLAINPMHVFLSRFPVAENLVVFFSASAFYYLLRYLNAREVGPSQVSSLVLSAGAWAGLFFTHIGGFLYAPLVVAVVAAGAVTAGSFGRMLEIAGYAFAVMAAYVLSLWYGMTWSFPYSYGTYVGVLGLGPGTFFVNHWKGMTYVLAILSGGFFYSLWRFRIQIRSTWTRLALDRMMTIVLLAVLAGTAVFGVIEAYRLGLTSDYTLLTDPRNPRSTGFDAAGENWAYQRSQLSNTGAAGFVHSSLMALAIYVSPFILLFALAAVVLKRRTLGIFEIFFLALITWFLVLRVGRGSLTLYYYYGRYLGAELVPYLLVLASIWLYSLLRSEGRLKRIIAGGMLGLALTWEALALAPQYPGGEMLRLDASLRPPIEKIGDHDLVIIAGGAYPALRTALGHYYGKNTVVVDPNTLKAAINQYSKHWSDIYILSDSDNLPDLGYIGALTLVRDTYNRGGAYDVLPTGSSTTEKRYYLFRVDPRELARLEESAGISAPSIDFTKGPYPGYVATVEGISNVEPDGRWTDGATAKLRFTRPLPTHFTLDLDFAQAYGPNSNLPSRVRIADEEREFTPARDRSPLKLEFDLRRSTDTIEIVIAKPTSPLSAGESGDPRMLGIRLKSLRVTPRQQQ
jgi:hypothetical protein